MRRCWGIFSWVIGTALGFAPVAVAQSASDVAARPGFGRFEVALHARTERRGAHAEQAAWLSVALPLDKLALSSVAERPRLAELVTAPPAEPTQVPLRAPSPGPEAAPAPSVSFAQLRVLSELTRRATVVALTVAGAAAERGHLDSLSARARSSALLPELRLRVARSTDQALRWAPTVDDPYRATQADAAGMVLEGSATFRLEHLLFSHEELAIQRLRLREGELRLKLEGRVQAAVLGLFRARELGCDSDPNDPARARASLKALELFAELDQLTCGWFSDQAQGFARALWGFPEAVLGVCDVPKAPSAGAGTNPVASLEDSE